MAEEQVATLMRVMERMNDQIVALTDTVGQLQAAQRGGGPRDQGHVNNLIPKDYRPDKFVGNGFGSWSDEVKGYLGFKRPKLAEVVKWAENKRNGAISPHDAEIETQVTQEENAELHYFLSTITGDEARIIVRSVPANGAEAWRKLKTRYEPQTEVNNIGGTLRVMQPNKINHVKNLMAGIERWEDDLRRQDEKMGSPVLTDASKRAILTAMVPDELKAHLQLNADRFETYEQLRGYIVNYVSLKLPAENMKMQVDHVEANYDFPYSCAECDDDNFLFAFGPERKGKGKGKFGGKGKAKGKGKDNPQADLNHSANQGNKGEFKGYCWHCGGYGHRAVDCPSRAEVVAQKGAKAGGKGKGVNLVDDEQGEANLGTLTVDLFSLDEDTKEGGDGTRKISKYYEVAQEISKTLNAMKRDLKTNLLKEAESSNHQETKAENLLLGNTRQPVYTKSGKPKGRFASGKNKAVQVEVETAENGTQTETIEDTGHEGEAKIDDEGDYAEYEAKTDDEDDYAAKLARAWCQDKLPSHQVYLGAVDEGKDQNKEGAFKVTVDSGAAISVMPPNMLENIPMNDGPSGRQYRAANGAKLPDLGGKKIAYKTGRGVVGNMQFRVASVTKPLAAVSSIVARGNRVVFDHPRSYIENKKTGHQIEVEHEDGVYTITIPKDDIANNHNQGFTRQGA